MTPKEAQDYFRGLSSRLRDLSPVTEVVATKTKEFIEDRFERTIDAEGTPWAPLSNTTFSINPARRGQPPLTDTGNLRRSVSILPDPDGIRISITAPYANAQNFGNPNNRVFGRARGPIPERRFLPIEKNLTLMTDGEAGEHWEEMRQLILTYLLDGNE